MELKTIRLSEKGQISIPKHIRDGMKLKKGDKLVLVAKGERLIVQKADAFIARFNLDEESLGTMMLSEAALRKDWDNKYDERWNKY